MTTRQRAFAGFLLVVLAGFLTPGAGRVCAGQNARAKELDIDDIPVSILDAEVGEWALYHLADGRRSRLTVVEKWEDGDETFLRIVNEITNSKGKRPRYSEEVVEVGEAARTLRRLGPDDRIHESEVLLHGRTLDVVVISYYDDGELVRQSYLSEDVPVYGLVKGINPKSKARIKTALSLLDYGFAEDE